jgi:exopolysaccharide biosynthesis polyprenyl glycosylphosphotransferase
MRRGHGDEVDELTVVGPEVGPDVDRPDLRRILVGLDALAIAVPWSAVLIGLGDFGRAPAAAALEVALVTVAALWLIASHRLYRARVCAVRAFEISRLLRVAALVGIATVAAAGVTPLVIGPGAAALASGLTALSLIVLRGLYRSWLGHRRQQGLSVRPVILVGVNEETRELIELMSDHPELGYSPSGVVGSRSNAIQLGLDHLWRGHVSSASRVVQELDATGAIVAANALSSSELNAVIRDLLAVGTHVHLSYGLRGIHHRRLLATPLAHEPLYYIEPSSLSKWQLAAKRGLDVAIGSLALLVSTPVLVLAALAIKLYDRGPVLFRQERVGQNGRPFRIYKLRTMVVDAEELLVDLRDKNERAGPLFKLTSDPRVTGIGRILRLTSIDELPQLFNVLRGEMSLVGPRPALPSEVATFDDELLARSRVLPGITGLWQVEARDNPSFDSYRRLDLFYVENWSVTLDLVILLGTLEAEVLRVFRALSGRKREVPERALATVGASE